MKKRRDSPTVIYLIPVTKGLELENIREMVIMQRICTKVIFGILSGKVKSENVRINKADTGALDYSKLSLRLGLHLLLLNLPKCSYTIFV